MEAGGPPAGAGTLRRSARRWWGPEGWLQPFVPRFRDGRFWWVQLFVVLIAVLDGAVDAFWPDVHALSLAAVTLVFVPVTYAALNFGFAGSLATALWVAALSGAVVVIYHGGGARLEQLSVLAAVLGVGVFTGRRVEAETAARRRAEEAEAAWRASEFRYRELFEGSPVPVLLLDEGGAIREANAAAAELLGRPGGDLRGRPLAELLGEGAAAALAEALAAQVPGAGRPLAVRRQDGAEAWLEPAVTRVAGDRRETWYQVLLRDVTGEHRRHEDLRAYAGSILRGQEEERRRIAQELHDDTIQSLILLCRQVDAIQDAHGAAAPGLADQLGQLREAIEDVVHSLRRFARSLRPPILDDLGLVPSIRHLLGELRRQTGTSGRLRVRGDVRRLPSDVELGLFRIAQEALRNVERHARATRVAVELAFDEREVRLTVRDDGVGFASALLEAAGGERGLGLLGMRERAQLLGGWLEIRSAPGRGTVVRVGVPAA